MQSFVAVPHFVLCLKPRQLDGNVAPEIPPGVCAPRPGEPITAVVDYCHNSQQWCRSVFLQWCVMLCTESAQDFFQNKTCRLWIFTSLKSRPKRKNISVKLLIVGAQKSLKKKRQNKHNLSTSTKAGNF